AASRDGSGTTRHPSPNAASCLLTGEPLPAQPDRRLICTVQQRPVGPVPRAGRPHDPAAEPALEPVYTPQAVLPVLKLRFERLDIVVGHAPHVVGRTALRTGPVHRLPLQGVGGHAVALL